MCLILVSFVLSNCRIDSQFDHVRTYSWYSDELVSAITKTNMEYRLAIKNSTTTIIANLNFITSIVEIMKNCSDENNTMCQYPNDNTVYLENSSYCIVLAVLFIVICVFVNLRK